MCTERPYGAYGQDRVFSVFRGIHVGVDAAVDGAGHHFGDSAGNEYVLDFPADGDQSVSKEVFVAAPARFEAVGDAAAMHQLETFMQFLAQSGQGSAFGIVGVYNVGFEGFEDSKQTKHIQRVEITMGRQVHKGNACLFQEWFQGGFLGYSDSGSNPSVRARHGPDKRPVVVHHALFCLNPVTVPCNLNLVISMQSGHFCDCFQTGADSETGVAHGFEFAFNTATSIQNGSCMSLVVFPEERLASDK